MDMQNQHICPFAECGKFFKAKKSLVEHMRIHKGEKPYKCHFEGCDKRFTQYSSMQKHERTHTGDKPYKCSICDRDFTQISNLKRHERVHAGEKPHECEICQKKFSTASNLKQHLHVHEKGDIRTKFLCKICQKTYLYRSSLRKHLQEHGFQDTSSVIDSSLYMEIKIEHDENNIEHDENNYSQMIEPFSVKEEAEERYQEPEISKYIFIDPNTVVKSLPIEFKIEEEIEDDTNESQNSASENQATYTSTRKISLDLFPSSPSDYLNKNTEPESESKLLPLASLIGSPLRDRDCRDRDCRDSFWDTPFTFSKPKNTKGVINYKDEIYYLYDRTLNRMKPNGELVMRQIDNDFVNPSRGDRLPEISHYPDYQSLLKVYQEIVSNYKCLNMEMLLSEKNCNSLTCKGNSDSSCKNCGHDSNDELGYERFIGGESPSIFYEDRFPSSPSLFLQQDLNECPLEDNFCNRIKDEKTKNKDGHLCLCEITRKYKHVHGPNCGHPAILHDGHVDYIVDGKLHHPDGDHCEDHGPIYIVENTSNEYAMSLIASNFLPDCKNEIGFKRSDSYMNSFF